MKRFGLFLTLTLLTLFSASAFADGNPISTSQLIGCGGAPLACTMLGKIFGNVAPLHANDGVLNNIMQIVNLAMSVVIGLYCGYTSLSSVHEILKSGLQTVQMQLAMPFMRLALAMSLLVPLPGSGYSTYQSIVMNVAVAGANLANMVWNKTVQSIVSGMRINPTSDSENDVSASLYNTTQGTPYGANGGLGTVTNYQYVQSLFQNALCYEEQKAAHAVASKQSIQGAASSSPTASGSGPTLGMYSIDTVHHKLNIPTYTYANNSASSPCMQVGEQIYTNQNNNTHLIQFSTNSMKDTSSLSSSAKDVINTAYDSLAVKLFASLDTVAQQVVAYQQQNPKNTTLFDYVGKPSSALATSGAQAVAEQIGTTIAQDEVSYAQTMQDIILPAAAASANASKDASDKTSASDSINLLAKLLPSNQPAATTIAANPLASFMNAGTFFFTMANADEKSDGSSTVPTLNTNSVSLDSVPVNNGGNLLAKNYIANQYKSFLSKVIGNKDVGLGSEGTDNDLFHLYFSDAANANNIIDGQTSFTGNMFNAVAVSAASKVLAANSATIAPTQQNSDNMSNAATQDAADTGSNIAGVLPLVGDISAMIADFSANSSNPWNYASRIGKDLVGFALGILVIPPVVLGIVNVVAGSGVIDCFADAKSLTDGIYNSVRPLLMAVACVCLVSGLLLMFVMPMMPYIMYMLAIIAWLALVIEGMVAAPLVAALIAHPEGHHFWGKSEIAVTLLLNMFIYPTLLIIGMVTCIALIYVSLDLVNMTFGAALVNSHSTLLWGTKTATIADKGGAIGPAARLMMSAAGSTATLAGLATMGIGAAIVEGIASLLAIPIVVMLYTCIVLMVVKQCSNIIFMLPGKVSRWISVQGEHSDVGQATQQFQQGNDKNMQPFGSRFNFPESKLKDRRKGAAQDGASNAGDSASDQIAIQAEASKRK